MELLHNSNRGVLSSVRVDSSISKCQYSQSDQSIHFIKYGDTLKLHFYRRSSSELSRTARSNALSVTGCEHENEKCKVDIISNVDGKAEPSVSNLSNKQCTGDSFQGVRNLAWHSQFPGGPRCLPGGPTDHNSNHYTHILQVELYIDKNSSQSDERLCCLAER